MQYANILEGNIGHLVYFEFRAKLNTGKGIIQSIQSSFEANMKGDTFSCEIVLMYGHGNKIPYCPISIRSILGTHIGSFGPLILFDLLNDFRFRFDLVKNHKYSQKINFSSKDPCKYRTFHIGKLLRSFKIFVNIT